MVSEALHGNQPNGFPPALASSDLVAVVGTEDEGITSAISQVIGYGRVLINVVTV